MKRKVILILSSLFVMISFQSFSQTTTTESAHPKMDKYYPRPQKTQVLDNNADTSSVIPAPARPIAQTSPAPVMTTAPASNNTVVNPATAVTPTAPPAPVEPQIQAGPAVTSTPVTVEPSNTTVSNSNTVTTPSAVTVNKPVQKIVPQTAPYVDPASLFTTRLGSSAPQYNTWEKNNDGTGSVTTQSKQ